MFSAKIIADSKVVTGERLTTFVVTMPRIVLAEFNTHRMFSRNSASSRAIPFKKMLESVKNNPFIPLRWQKDHSGMQGNEYFGETHIPMCEAAWLEARDAAVDSAEKLNQGIGVTKQLANRILEPFMWHTVIVTASEWENFFALRAHEAAEIHIAHLAQLMLNEYNQSSPKLLKEKEWHIPFGDQIDFNQLFRIIEADHGVYDPVLFEDFSKNSPGNNELIYKYLCKIAVARCARVSYTVVGEEAKSVDYRKDIELHNRLLASGHLSPFEHVASAMTNHQYEEFYTRNDGTGDGWSGNFKGFLQYRKVFKDENRKDTRVVKK